MADPVRRRALSIAVGSFEDSRRDLAYASDFAGRLRTALTDLGYECLSPPDVPSSESIDTAVRDAIGSSGPDDVLLVHLITHAERAGQSQSVYVLGSDERPAAPLEEWVRSVEDRPGPLTLFLLDVCYGGAAARLPWQASVADGNARAWVIGASTPRGAAYDGRLTRAVVNVIGALRRGELDLDATLRNAPFVTVARAIGQEVKRLVEEVDGFAQQATGSLLDITAIPPELPFFPNLAARTPSAAQQARAEVDAAIRPFLDDVDEALDARHFFERAAGGPQVTMGCFSGRGKELRELVPWMQGYGDGRLRVLTGSPGVGKSAILGVMVCAAHTILREATAEVWKHVEAAPWRIRHLAAVHARKRGPQEITASLARQLGIAADDLVAGVTALDEVPVIVLDALDEADLPDQVMGGLLLPLAGAVRDDGRPAVRLLIGTRRWGFEPLLDRARAVNGLIDLDEVDREVLYDEIETYVNRLLRANPVYRGRGAVRGAFAADVARSLSAPPSPNEERWGEFLVAGLYSRHFISGPEIGDPAKASDLGGRVPRTLPEVFSLDFEGASSEARSLLAALAYAQGEGMPLALAIRAATAVATAPAEGGRAPWDAALEAARFYLRRATDVDGTTIYRIFHEGLAEHLREEPLAASAIYAALLSPLDGPRGRRWDLAEPYLLRHAPDHAIAAGRIEDLLGDMEFWIHGDPAALAALAELSPSHADLASVSPAASPRDRRRALTMAAVRTGDTELAGRLAVAPDGAPPPWRPVWAIKDSGEGRPAGTVRLLGRLDGHSDMVNTVAIARLDGTTVAVTGSEDKTVRLWDLATLTQLSVVAQPSPVRELGVGRDTAGLLVLCADKNGHLRGGNLNWSDLPELAMTGVVRVLAAGDVNGEFAAVHGTASGGVLLWRHRASAFLSRVVAQHNAPTECAALGRRPDGTAFALTGDQGGRALIHELGTDTSRRLLSVDGPLNAIAAGVLDGRSVVLTAGAVSLELWDEASGDRIGSVAGPANTVLTLAVGEVGERTVAITGDDGGTVGFWDLRTRAEISAPRALGAGAVTAVAFGELDGEAVAVSGAEDGSIHVWWLRDTAPPALVGTSRAGDMPVVVVRSDSDAVSIADLRTGSVVATVPAGRRGTVAAVRTVVVADRQLPLLCFTGGSRSLWDLSGELGDVTGPAGPDPDPPTTATVVRDGRLGRFTGHDDGAVTYSPHGSSASSVIGRHDDRVVAVTASRLSGRGVLYTAAGRTVRVWDVDTARPLDGFEAPGVIHALRADPAGYVVLDAGTEVICFAHSSATA